jgi:hypothetical protein
MRDFVVERRERFALSAAGADVARRAPACSLLPLRAFSFVTLPFQERTSLLSSVPPICDDCAYCLCCVHYLFAEV